MEKFLPRDPAPVSARTRRPEIASSYPFDLRSTNSATSPNVTWPAVAPLVTGALAKPQFDGRRQRARPRLGHQHRDTSDRPRLDASCERDLGAWRVGVWWGCDWRAAACKHFSCRRAEGRPLASFSASPTPRRISCLPVDRTSLLD
jgi:hypothetical protein